MAKVFLAPGTPVELLPRMRAAVRMYRKWSRALGLDPDSHIYLRYAPKGKYRQRVSDEKSQYFRWSVELTSLTLESPREQLEADVIHETLHMCISRYTKLSWSLVPESCRDALSDAEEGIVTRLEYAICRLIGNTSPGMSYTPDSEPS